MNIPTSEGPAVATIGVARPPLSWYPPNTCDPRPAVAASGVEKAPLANAFCTPALAVENKFGLVTFFNFDNGPYGFVSDSLPTIATKSHGVPLVV